MGRSLRHRLAARELGRLAASVIGALLRGLASGASTVYTPDVRVRIAATDRSTHPGVSVVRYARARMKPLASPASRARRAFPGSRPLLVFSALLALVGPGGCVDVLKGPGLPPAPPPPPSLAAASSLACEDRAKTPHAWKASYKVDRVESCVFHRRDDLLEIKLQGGEVDEWQLTLHEFKGTGGYETSGDAKGTRVSLLARGGSEGAATTRVGTETEACPARCTIEVPEAKVTEVEPNAKGSVTVEVTCASLAGPGPGCVTCKVATPVARLTIPTCTRAD